MWAPRPSHVRPIGTPAPGAHRDTRPSGRCAAETRLHSRSAARKRTLDADSSLATRPSTQERPNISSARPGTERRTEGSACQRSVGNQRYPGPTETPKKKTTAAKPLDPRGRSESGLCGKKRVPGPTRFMPAGKPAQTPHPSPRPTTAAHSGEACDPLRRGGRKIRENSTAICVQAN